VYPLAYSLMVQDHMPGIGIMNLVNGFSQIDRFTKLRGKDIDFASPNGGSGVNKKARING
jgi:hypothetical protein